MTGANSIGEGVGRVETRFADISLPSEGFRLECGRSLRQLRIAYETYGRLSPQKDNVVFVCHALSGDAHAAGHHGDPERTRGWWDAMIGPGRGIDTDHYHVICANILGGCKGTTGPSSINSDTGRPYGSSFPPITVWDIGEAHRLLLSHLGINRLAAVIGGSFGGMQVLEWAIRRPDMVSRAVCIASAPRLSAQALAFDVVGRDAITSDPEWRGGDYYDAGRGPVLGLALARKIGHITYLSQEMMERKFGRERMAAPPCGNFSTNFQVESYLDHQGDKFLERFDANSYLYITKAMDEFDIVERYGSLEKAFSMARARMLVAAVSSDWLFPPEQSSLLANAMLRAGRSVAYCVLQAPHGHDAFLVDVSRLSDVIRAFLPWVGVPADHQIGSDRTDRPEFQIIASMIKPGSRVLDLGCGDGELLSFLRKRGAADTMGVDIDIDSVIAVIDRGHDVFQADIDAGLAAMPDRSYDYAVLSETLPLLRRPRFVLSEMLRVAREGIISFPNTGSWRHRAAFLFSGRVPVPRGRIAEAWYDSGILHSFSWADFVDLCRRDGIKIVQTVCLPTCAAGRLLLGMGRQNLGAEHILVRVTK